MRFVVIITMSAFDNVVQILNFNNYEVKLMIVTRKTSLKNYILLLQCTKQTKNRRKTLLLGKKYIA